jgi:hypothetical protein
MLAFDLVELTSRNHPIPLFDLEPGSRINLFERPLDVRGKPFIVVIGAAAQRKRRQSG